MFLLLAKQESTWESSTASTKRCKLTDDATGYVESEGKNMGLRILRPPVEVSGEIFKKIHTQCISQIKAYLWLFYFRSLA